MSDIINPLKTIENDINEIEELIIKETNNEKLNNLLNNKNELLNTKLKLSNLLFEYNNIIKIKQGIIKELEKERIHRRRK